MAARKPATRTNSPRPPPRPKAKKPAEKKAPAREKLSLITRDEPAKKKKRPPVGPLSGKQRRALRALGHHLEPVVLVGSAGVTEGVIAAVEQALDDHELIKVKINEGPEDRKEAAAKIAQETGAALAQVLGRTALLYRPDPDEPKIEV